MLENDQGVNFILLFTTVIYRKGNKLCRSKKLKKYSSLFKRDRLLRFYVNYGRKKLYNIEPRSL